MSLLLDLFGFLNVVLRGLALAAQVLCVGSVFFYALVARPFASQLGAEGTRIMGRCIDMIVIGGLSFAVVKAMILFLQVSTISSTTGLAVENVIGASFAVFSLIGVIGGLSLAVLARKFPSVAGLGLLVFILLVSNLGVTHAMARIDGREVALAATFLHYLGASVWIGGIPCFLIALNRTNSALAWRLIGRRFSLMCMAAVGCLLVGGVSMACLYVGSFAALYGTAYGLMTMNKVAMFGGLLLLGFLNNRVIERLRQDPTTPILRLKRFAEVEIGIGFTVLMAAASLTSLPPGVDLTEGRVTPTELAERLSPRWPPVLVSPDLSSLAFQKLQSAADAKAALRGEDAPLAYVPGAGVPPPGTLEDQVWSEYNHNWAGVFLLAIALLAMLDRTGKVRWAKHWPLIFIPMAVFLIIRSDPESWPMGPIGFWAGMRDPAVAQHKLSILVIIIFGLFEWSVRTGRLKSPKAAMVFPLITAFMGALLFSHSHSLGNVKEELLAEYSHAPLALAGVMAAWARWLELRLDGKAGRIAGHLWPVGFLIVALILLFYRET
jgi:copper resistance protein D